MKIVIIGAGIGGCAAYLSLKKRLPKPPFPDEDHEYTVYEAHDTSTNMKSHRDQGETHSATLLVGGGLGVGPNGLKILERLDEELFHDIVRAGYPYGTMKFMNSYGYTLMRMSTRGADPAINSVSMSRQAIWECLRSRVPDEILVKKRVVEVVASADGRNIIKLADGSVDVEADLVIGADGLKSRTKRALFPESNEDPFPPHYDGLVGIGGFFPAADLGPDVEAGAMTIVFGANGFFGYAPSETSPTAPNRHIPQGILPPGDSVMWWSTYGIDECPDANTIDKEAVRRELQKRYSSWRDPVIQKIISNVQVETMWPVWTTPELPTWERDGVVLVGDAAHTLPPTSGQGSSQALEDVESFSMLLSYYLQQGYGSDSGRLGGPGQIRMEKDIIKRAAKTYMDIRQPRVTDLLKKAKRMESKKRDLNIVEEWMMYLVFFIIGHIPLPSWLKNPYGYNIADEVKKVIDAEKQQPAK